MLSVTKNYGQSFFSFPLINFYIKNVLKNRIKLFRFAAFRERKSQIEKDVSRTDRSHPFYLGDNNSNVNLLQVMCCNRSQLLVKKTQIEFV
jgi:hypothetical protein